MSKYQVALDSVRKEVKATFFDTNGKQWWTNDTREDYRCNILQEAVVKAEKFDEIQEMLRDKEEQNNDAGRGIE